MHPSRPAFAPEPFCILTLRALGEMNATKPFSLLGVTSQLLKGFHTSIPDPYRTYRAIKQFEKQGLIVREDGGPAGERSIRNRFMLTPQGATQASAVQKASGRYKGVIGFFAPLTLSVVTLVALGFVIGWPLVISGIVARAAILPASFFAVTRVLDAYENRAIRNGEFHAPSTKPEPIVKPESAGFDSDSFGHGHVHGLDDSDGHPPFPSYRSLVAGEPIGARSALDRHSALGESRNSVGISGDVLVL